MQTRTIVALATPRGNAGLAAVRLSGPEAVAVAQRVFSGADSLVESGSHRAVYGILKWPSGYNVTDYNSGEIIDQAIALPLLAPRSYSGEDTVEFYCHGGQVIAQAVVSACCAAGAVPATAGEFTRRAFLNGKLSLDQAEAVADLIHAESTSVARAAVGQLLGGLDSQVAAIEAPLLELLARIEGSLEFMSEEEVSVPRGEMRQILGAARRQIAELLELAVAGRLLRDGIQVVLIGPPNVGKSSLFNALLKEQRALVDAEAGTTRDVVSARIVHQGTVYEFHDTAGLRPGGGRVEKMGMDRTRQQAGVADIVLDLQDGSAGAAAEAGNEPELGSECWRSAGSRVAPRRIAVLTKGDLWSGEGAPEASEAEFVAEDVAGEPIVTSSLTGSGIDLVWRQLEAAVDEFRLNEAIDRGVVINERHRHKLENCHQELGLLLQSLDGADIDSPADGQESNILAATEADPGGGATAPGDEVVGTVLASILSELGEVTGRVFSEHLLDAVFSRFCVGK